MQLTKQQSKRIIQQLFNGKRNYSRLLQIYPSNHPDDLAARGEVLNNFDDDIKAIEQLTENTNDCRY